MTTITSPDLRTVRRRSGDNSAPYDLDEAEIDAIYVNPALGNLDLDRTTFFVLRERWGIAGNLVPVSGALGGIVRNPKFDQIERLLKYYSELTGIGLDDFAGSGFAEWSLNSV